ncbi:YbdK family carboxylate-amine ligase [Streptomyces sp. ISL-10]|uniref:carboxylate-amine ligase n=1 Tax=Streptomyces sp. ISL-10 TaxID=2819172 RepID=UPI001BEC40C5|nr:YbdK family carboxylate-amine ligase [Streptomyces sp. ISL-10]MBT2365506.1 YbdK family carboxylate-amine ligase [Streptomyces sp. ISL-10]
MHQPVQGPGRVPTVGVEEEFFVVRADSRAPEPAGSRVVARARGAVGDLVAGEFHESQIEVRTPPCGDADEVHRALVSVRSAAAAAARAEGLALCASGTPVIGGPGARVVGDHPRYRAGVRQFGAMLDDFTVCSAHVHVHVPERETAVMAGNHVRPWLPLLIAMSANSPFFHGRDTGYASWRTVVRLGFPALSAPPYADSAAHYERLTAVLEASEAMLDANNPFWDLRPNPRVPTLEVRVMDVSADPADTAALAALVRALVVRSVTLVRQGDPGPRTCGELLRASYWRAARDGWAGAGVDGTAEEVVPFEVQAARLVGQVREVLAECGDLDRVTAFLGRLAARGCGAQRQRALWQRRHRPADVVDGLLAGAGSSATGGTGGHDATAERGTSVRRRAGDTGLV